MVADVPAVMTVAAIDGEPLPVDGAASQASQFVPGGSFRLERSLPAARCVIHEESESVGFEPTTLVRATA